MDKGNFRELLTVGNILLAICWLFWVAVFSLACNELLYLFRGYGDFATSIGAGITMSVAKHYYGTFDRTEEDLRKQVLAYRKFARNALAWSGPQVYEVSDTRQLDEGLAYGVVVDATVGFPEYNSEPTSDYSRDLVRDLLPSDVHAYLSQIKELERIDRLMKYVAERIGPGDDDNLLHDIRAVTLRAIFDITKKDKDAFERQFSAALTALGSKAHSTPPIQRLIIAVKTEYERSDSKRIVIGDWQIVSSWIKVRPPKTFDDLLGFSGIPIPEPPKEKFRTYDG